MPTPVKLFSSTLPLALEEERHFALVESLPYQAWLARNRFRSGFSIRPMHLFGHNCDHDYYFGLLPEGGAGCPIKFSVFYCTPWRFSGCPACEPNCFTCS